MELAAKEGCQQMHLDSGTQRKDAHRFYERQGMTMASFHFRRKRNAQPGAPEGRAASGAPLDWHVRR